MLSKPENRSRALQKPALRLSAGRAGFIIIVMQVAIF